MFAPSTAFCPAAPPLALIVPENVTVPPAKHTSAPPPPPPPPAAPNTPARPPLDPGLPGMLIAPANVAVVCESSTSPAVPFTIVVVPDAKLIEEKSHTVTSQVACGAPPESCGSVTVRATGPAC
jgi:hypothetical protein